MLGYPADRPAVRRDRDRTVRPADAVRRPGRGPVSGELLPVDNLVVEYPGKGFRPSRSGP